MAMQSAVKEALASAIARGVNPRGVHRARTIGASVRARRTVCAAADAEGGAAESPSEDARTVPARPPPLRTYYADWAEVMLPDGHRFPMEKYQATRLVLEEDKSLTDIMELVPSPKASLIDVLAVHEEGYVTRVLGCALTEKEGRAIGFPMMNPSQVTRSLASTGGTVAATHDVLRADTTAKCAAQIAGGTHHAFRDKGEGFCVFNDIAVAATNAMRKFPERFAGAEHPILVIDLDVHQGNGTAKIFEDDPRVITFSAHGAGNYPWKTRMRSDHDVDVPDGTGDLEYIALMEEWLPKLFDTYSPRLVYFQAGVDALAVDSFGKLKMTRAGMLRRNHMVYDECIKRDVPLVITMGGGYSKPFDASVDAHADVFRAAAYRFASPPTEPKGKKAVEVEDVEEVEVEEVEEVAEEVIEKVVAKANAKSKPAPKKSAKSDKFTTRIAAQKMTAAADRAKLVRAIRDLGSIRDETPAAVLVEAVAASKADKPVAAPVDWAGAVGRALRTVAFSALAPARPETVVEEPVEEPVVVDAVVEAPVVVDRRPARAPAPPPPPPPAPVAAEEPAVVAAEEPVVAEPEEPAVVDGRPVRRKAPPPPPPPPGMGIRSDLWVGAKEPEPVDPWAGVVIPAAVDRPPGYPKPSPVTYQAALSKALRTVSIGDRGLYLAMTRRAMRTVSIEHAPEDRSSYFLALGRALRDVDFAEIGGLDEMPPAAEAEAEDADDMLQRARERVRVATAKGNAAKVSVAVGSRKKKKKGGLAAPLAERAPAEAVTVDASR